MALYDEFAPQPNRLITAQSAYLRSAAYQPVGWYEFGPDAFAEAQRQGKPLLLDIGAIWCHWCHVMDRESYDDPEIATLINERFIPVKVDRDERPDIDARCQTAVQLLTGQGGWPLTVFLTPDGHPFYGGSYFPPEDRYNRTGMKSLLLRLAETYQHRRADLDEVARVLVARVRQAGIDSVENESISDDTLAQIAQGVQQRFNAEQGGFEHKGPKFSHASAIELALRQWDMTGDTTWRTIIDTTLTAMGRGGIYDQLGGGFHRYTTDDQWTVPHFEKMGYDNALLLSNYVHAYCATGNDSFREIAEGTLNCLLRDFTDQQHGGFFSSQDADNSPHDDGNYWTWSFAEIRDILPPEEFAVLARYYGVTRQGNIPESHRNVLHISEEPESIARQLEVPFAEVLERIVRGKQKLVEVRHHRKTPRIDTDKYADTNALLITALLQAGTLLQRDDATTVALRAADVLINDAYEPDHGIYHHFHGEQGASLPGFLADQVYTASALLECYSVSGNADYLDVARHLLDLCLEQCWDEDHGGFLDLARNRLEMSPVEFVGQPRKVIEDMPTPAPNAVAALALDRLWLLTHDAQYHDMARRTLETFAKHAPEYGPFAATYGLALSYHLHPAVTAVIVGEADADDTRTLWHSALQTYRPGSLVAMYPPDVALLPYPAAPDGQAMAYICAGESCAPPTSDVQQVRELLRSYGRSEREGA